MIFLCLWKYSHISPSISILQKHTRSVMAFIRYFLTSENEAKILQGRYNLLMWWWCPLLDDVMSRVIQWPLILSVALSATFAAYFCWQYHQWKLNSSVKAVTAISETLTTWPRVICCSIKCVEELNFWTYITVLTNLCKVAGNYSKFYTTGVWQLW